MFDTILLAVDFSRHSVMALKMAMALCEGTQRKLHVLTVCDASEMVQMQGVFGTSDRAIHDSEKAVMERAEKQLDELCLPLDAMGVEYIKTIRKGSPVNTILDYVAEHHCDLIVIGSHSRRSILDINLGGTTTSVVRKAPCPVLVASPPEEVITGGD